MSFSLGAVLPDTRARLAVVWWHQRNGEFDEFRQIAYDVPLEAGSDEVEIPYASVALPYAENLICFRGCTDRSICDCEGLPQVALASVVVSIDADGDGTLSLDELRREQVGGAEALIGWGPQAQSSVPRGFDGIFDGPISAGFAVYERNEVDLLRPVLFPPDAGTAAHPIAFCPVGDAACTFPVTRLLCHRDCDREWGLNRLGI